MFIVIAHVPKTLNPTEMGVPERARPVGATPSWAPGNWEIPFMRREEADLLMNSLNAQPGVTARVEQR